MAEVIDGYVQGVAKGTCTKLKRTESRTPLTCKAKPFFTCFPLRSLARFHCQLRSNAYAFNKAKNSVSRDTLRAAFTKLLFSVHAY